MTILLKWEFRVFVDADGIHHLPGFFLDAYILGFARVVHRGDDEVFEHVLAASVQERGVNRDRPHDIRAGHGHAHKAIARSAAYVDVLEFFLNLFKFLLNQFGLLHHTDRKNDI